MTKPHLLWHEPSNTLAVADQTYGGLPLLTILDDDFVGINPYYTYPIQTLQYFGWVDLGEL